MRVLKFGGSSVATVESIRQVAAIVRSAACGGKVLVVVSALSGTTDSLLQAAAEASARSGDFMARLEALLERHRQTLSALAPEGQTAPERQALVAAGEELRDLLRGCELLQEASPRTVDRIVSYGERLSSVIVAAALKALGVAAPAIDARRLIVTDATFGDAQVDFEATRRRVRRELQEIAGTPVVTGFIAATAEGETTTLGRGGSDYTASLLGAALDAEAVELWTDVDGVLDADPRLVKEARPVASMSYVELMEMSHFGAKVVYPPSVHPTRRQGIPLWIKNTFDPTAPGTRVCAVAEPDDRPVRGIASIPSIALLRLEGDGMVGVPGIAGRLFGALARYEVSVILISQASSEHSICFAVSPGAVASAQEAVGKEFALERQAGWVDELIVEKNLSVVAVVGNGMRYRSGLAGNLFAVLGSHGISVRAIAQGSSELNISIVIDSGDESHAVRALHKAFFSKEPRTVEVFLAGVGRIGRALLDQLAAHWPAVEAREGTRLRLAGVAGRHRYCLGRLDPETAIDELTPTQDEGLGLLLSAALDSAEPCRVFIDCTASPRVAAEHHRLLSAGVSVVTANKVCLAGPGDAYEALMAASPGRLYYETTVGAGLPVVRTFADLVATGDTLRRLEGLFSGTLSFLVDRLTAGMPFSEALRSAHQSGLTEPDPREDLAGRDVARKLLILGRLAGRKLEPEAIEVEPWLPEDPWKHLSLEGFWQRLPEADAAFADRFQQAAAKNQRLSYLGTLDEGGARIRWTLLPPEHPCARAQACDNLIALHTDRYDPNPLVVQGPGAGPEVTAAGVFADLLRAVSEKPRRRTTAPLPGKPSGDPS